MTKRWDARISHLEYRSANIIACLSLELSAAVYMPTAIHTNGGNSGGAGVIKGESSAAGRARHLRGARGG